MLPSPLTPLEPLAPQVPRSPCVTQALWVPAALPPRPEPKDGPRVLWRSNTKELTPFPHPSDPHSLCEIYLRVVPSEGRVSRRPGGPGAEVGSFLQQEPATHGESTPHCRPLLGLSPRPVAVDATVSACTILIQLFQAPTSSHISPPPPCRGAKGGVRRGRGQGLQRHMALYLECAPREGKWGRGNAEGRWGPLSPLNKVKVQIKLTCSICAQCVPSMAGAGERPRGLENSVSRIHRHGEWSLGK